MQSSIIDDDNDDENRLDLRLLQCQVSSITPSLNSSIDPKEQEIWPLYLSTTFLDHYIFGELIGNGSYAEVRECIETRSLKRCAVKIVNKSYLKRQGANALLNQKQEIKLLRKINHPNIITLIECIHRGPKIYIFLEYCTFVLHNVLQEQPDNRMSPPLACYLFNQLITGIDYLHSIGVVHRDIKPQNLLISNEGFLKIIDFGVSQVLSIWKDSDTCFNHEGSPLFQAPEVVSGQREYAGFKIDVWSAGITLHLMLFGSYPFEDESLLGLYDKILSDDYVPSPILIDQKAVVDDLIGFMLEKSHEKRASTGEILNHPWLIFYRNGLSRMESHDPLTLINMELRKPKNQFSPDIYRSTSVLPFLYNYHFPQLQVTKVMRRLSPSDIPTRQNLTATSISQMGHDKSGSSPRIDDSSNSSASSTVSLAQSTGSSVFLDPNEILADRPIEWGTMEQYNLMKIPHVRVNRTRVGLELDGSRRRSSHSSSSNSESSQ